MDYDDHEYCDTCHRHEVTCWCQPAEPFNDPGRVETNLCHGHGDG